MFRHSFAHSPAAAGALKAALVLTAAAALVAAAADAALFDGARS
jgi:hypothetical protein